MDDQPVTAKLHFPKTKQITEVQQDAKNVLENHFSPTKGEELSSAEVMTNPFKNKPSFAKVMVPQNASEASIQEEARQAVEAHFKAKPQNPGDKLANANVLLTLESKK